MSHGFAIQYCPVCGENAKHRFEVGNGAITVKLCENGHRLRYDDVIGCLHIRE